MARINYNRPKRYDPLFSDKFKKECARDNKILKERVKKGYRNPQAHLHGPVKVYTPEERQAFVDTNPDILPR